VCIVECLLCIVVVLAAAPGLAYLFSRYYKIDLKPDLTHYLKTSDDWAIALHEYRPAGKKAKRKYPVILCHGLAGNHFGFDFTKELSVSRYLAARGHHVFAINLRGAGDSEKAGLFSRKRYRWNFDSYLRYDLPAFIDGALRVSGADKLHWVGHSMGGMLGYAIAQNLEIGPKLASVTAMCSPGRLDQFRPFLFARPILERFRRFYLGRITQIYTPLAERIPAFMKLLGFENLRPGHYAVASANLTEDVPVSLLEQFGDWAQKGVVESADGVDYIKGLSKLTQPFCMFAADQDMTAPPETVREVFDGIGSKIKCFHPMGIAYGHKDYYGHLTPLIGKDAPEESFPLLAKWLEEGFKGLKKKRAR
jgi:pimeloyl-ACP methyl ester carboxylesterase